MKNAHPNRKFCCTKHKDKFHNENNPRGYFKHLNPDDLNYEDDFDDPSWDAHKLERF